MTFRRRSRPLLPLLLALALFLGAAPVGAAGVQDDVDQALGILKRFGALPEQGIPRRVLANAEGLAILTVAKAGFIFSARGGRGVVLARTGRGWSPPSAIGTGGAGFGFQAGAQVSEFVLVLNTPAAVQAFASRGNVTLGAELSVAAGPVGRNLGAALSPRAAIYTYSRSQGVFAGLSLEGSVVATRNRANTRYFGRSVHPAEILRAQIATPPGAGPLVRALNAMAPDGAGSAWRSRHRREMPAVGRQVEEERPRVRESALPSRGVEAPWRHEDRDPASEGVARDTEDLRDTPRRGSRQR